MELSGRERVRLALAHRETDRIPIAMVCAGISPPAYVALEEYLQRQRGISVAVYLRPLIDVKLVEPRYIGPPLAEGEDAWGVRRQQVSYGAGGYDEISYYPLADVTDVGDLEKHRWPGAEWFDYAVLPDRISAIQAEQEHCLMATDGNIFETSACRRRYPSARWTRCKRRCAT